MRRIIIAFAMLIFFTANQAAMAYEQCKDASCVAGTMDIKKQADHKTKGPGCAAAHCSTGSHHIAAMPQDVVVGIPLSQSASPLWQVGLIHELSIVENLIEPPSIA